MLELATTMILDMNGLHVRDRRGDSHAHVTIQTRLLLFHRKGWKKKRLLRTAFVLPLEKMEGFSVDKLTM